MIKKGERQDIWFMYDERGDLKPVVIVTNESTVVELDHVIAKVTKQRPRNEFDVVVEDWEGAGLDYPSVVRCSKLRTVDNQLLRFKVGKMNDADFEKVIATIKSYF